MELDLIEEEIKCKIENDIDKLFDRSVDLVTHSKIDGSLKHGLLETTVEGILIKVLKRYWYFEKTPKDERKERVDCMLDDVKAAFDYEEGNL